MNNLARIEAQEAYIAKRGPLDAEIIAGLTPRWHILQTAPCHEASAAEYLSERKFGVYLPYYGVRTHTRFGKQHYAVHPMFPGYLFVFVWDVNKHARRILECPGVSAIVYFAGEPFIVPDVEINRIQTGEFLLEYADDIKKRRRRKRNREFSPTEINVWTKGLEPIDGDTRNLVLRKALGLYV